MLMVGITSLTCLEPSLLMQILSMVSGFEFELYHTPLDSSYHTVVIRANQRMSSQTILTEGGDSGKIKVLIRLISCRNHLQPFLTAGKLWKRVSLDRFQLKKHGCKCFLR